MEVRQVSVELAVPVGRQVLVCGASFAGLATAFWLAQLGYQVTVVEIARGLRRGGTPVDIEGDTIGILARMGLLDAVRAKVLPPRTMEFKSEDDGTIGVMAAQQDAKDERYEIHRDDLLDILFAAIEGSVGIMFGQSVRELANKSDGVAVTFDDGSRHDYALVFGCDGNRSRTRRLAFGDADFSYFMGGYFCLKVVPDTELLPPNVSQIFSSPGLMVMLNGYEDRTDLGFGFRSAAKIEYDHRDRAHQRAMIHRHFDSRGWKVPAMLRHLDADEHFYFDQINQIRMPTWSKGRVALVGDAGYCVSPLAGMGGSIALIGAAGLADALLRHGHDHEAAFGEYHDKLHPFVDDVQDRAATSGMAMMFPADDAELAERNRQLGEG
ncbi:FAD-dependent monooxygenase [Lichenihabitans psoromatis]|uniref:FAD-dependent monooxygenase n=1 Tax=Lichenihabitans psoromatis TaxID=2528642 RepID=UPI001035FCD4|nr:FAD-dependent monooxygenase [Lichenihabitans psoromatis]